MQPMIPTKIFKEFFESERAGGIILVIFTAAALLIANSPIAEFYAHELHRKIFGLSLEHWVNDGLMAIFFLLVGLELEREIYVGELRSFRNALLPICAAIGGMLIPAAIHLGFTFSTPSQAGAGIPMATDIAFSLGVLSLLSNRVPVSLKVFLTALAIADDLGAVLVIAIFYSKSLSLFYLGACVAIFFILCFLNRMEVKYLSVYLIGGIALWYCMLHSGIHATLSGVLLAFAIPFRDGGEASPSYRLQHTLHYPVAFGILPVFALVNTCIPIGNDWIEGLTHPNSLGIFGGLLVGKPVGILLMCYLVIQSKVCTLPPGLKWSHLVGASMLAGIGFTMSIFVSLLAFEGDDRMINFSQIAVLIASLVAAVAGAIWFLCFVPKEEELA